MARNGGLVDILKQMISSEKDKGGRPVLYKVYCHETDTVYSSCTEAARKLGCYRQKVWAVCVGIQTEHHGYHFSFWYE